MSQERCPGCSHADLLSLQSLCSLLPPHHHQDTNKGKETRSFLLDLEKNFLPVRLTYLWARCPPVWVVCSWPCLASGGWPWGLSEAPSSTVSLTPRGPHECGGWAAFLSPWMLAKEATVQDYAARTEGHHLHCFLLPIMDHNYNTWNVCGACFPEAQSPREYFSFSVSHTEARTHTL